MEKKNRHLLNQETQKPVCDVNLIGKAINNHIRDCDVYKRNQEIFPDPMLLELLYIQRNLNNNTIEWFRSVYQRRVSPKLQENFNDYRVPYITDIIEIEPNKMQVIGTQIDDFLEKILSERRSDFEDLEYILVNISNLPPDGSISSSRNEQNKSAMEFLCRHYREDYWINKIIPLRIESFILNSYGLILRNKPAYEEFREIAAQLVKKDKSKIVDPIPLSEHKDLTLIIDYANKKGVNLIFKTPKCRKEALAKEVLPQRQLDFLQKYYVNPRTLDQSKIIKPGQVDFTAENTKPKRSTIDYINSSLRKYVDWKGTKSTFKPFSLRKGVLYCYITIRLSSRTPSERFKASMN